MLRNRKIKKKLKLKDNNKVHSAKEIIRKLISSNRNKKMSH